MNYNELERFDLFRGLNGAEIGSVCECFNTRIQNYSQGETVVGEGERLKQFGVILGGTAHSFKTDPSGKVFTVAVIKEGEYIGVLLAGNSDKPSPVTVKAADRLTVMFMPFDKYVRCCSKNCSSHSIVMNNFIKGISDKALLLYERIECLIRPSIREKVTAYLIRQSEISEKPSEGFRVSLNRQDMADYLNVERSALSRELSNMKKDGLIDYNKDFFVIH